MLSDRQNSSHAKSTVNSISFILINIERVSKHSVTVVTTCWSWAWSNRASPSKWVWLGSPLAASSVYGDLTCSVHTVNNLCMFNCQCHFYLCNRGPYVRLSFVPNMLSSWNKDIIIVIINIMAGDQSPRKNVTGTEDRTCDRPGGRASDRATGPGLVWWVEWNQWSKQVLNIFISVSHITQKCIFGDVWPGKIQARLLSYRS